MTDTATLIHKWKLPIAQGEAREAIKDWVDLCDDCEELASQLDEPQIDIRARLSDLSNRPVTGVTWTGAYPDNFNHSDNSRT